MDVVDFESLPDGMGREEVEGYFYKWLADADTDALDVALRKLDILGDYQWHCYTLPSQGVRDALARWLLKTECSSEIFTRVALGACYCFGLSKELFTTFFRNYSGDNGFEYTAMLESSNGDDIDPYYSLKGKVFVES